MRSIQLSDGRLFMNCRVCLCAAWRAKSDDKISGLNSAPVGRIKRAQRTAREDYQLVRDPQHREPDPVLLRHMHKEVFW
jgi:hypothetical protein